MRRMLLRICEEYLNATLHWMHAVCYTDGAYFFACMGRSAMLYRATLGWWALERARFAPSDCRGIHIVCFARSYSQRTAPLPGAWPPNDFGVAGLPDLCSSFAPSQERN